MRRVFIVEDEAIVAMELEEHLRRLGFEPCGHASKGEEAIRRIPELRPDVVLMDIALADGISGIDVAERLRGVVDVPVIYVTAHSDPELTQRALRTGSFAYVGKPFDPRVLVTNMHLALSRHEATLALRASEARYRALFEQAAVGVAELDAGTARIIEVNGRFAALLGVEADALRGLELGASTHEGDRESERRALDSLGQGQASEAAYEKRCRRADGSFVWLSLHLSTLADGSGVRSRYIAIANDVSEHKRREEALRLLSTGLSGVTASALFDELAAGLASLLGVEVAFVGVVSARSPRMMRTIALVVDGEVRSAVECALEGSPCESVLQKGLCIIPEGASSLFPEDAAVVALGAEGWVGCPLVDGKGGVIGVLGIMSRRPLGDSARIESTVKLFAVRTAAELERQRAEERFVDVFDLAPDALVIVDERGRILEANRMAETTFGFGAEELSGLSVEDLIPERLRGGHAAMRAAFLSAGKTRRMGSARSRLQALRKDGVEIPVEISLSPLRSAHGAWVVAAIRDLTERARIEAERAGLEDQLRHAQKMESLGTLAGGIAHDFNNILAAISANVELAWPEVDPSDSVGECLSEIAAATRRARDLVKQILTFSRQQPTARVLTRAESIVEEAARLLRASLPASIELRIETVDGVPPVLADPSQLHQVIMNLGTNAWHAMERQQGCIGLRVDTATIDGDGSPLVALAPGTYARIQVADDGKGMDAMTLERIFEPFFTTKEVGRGTGLGLAVVHGIVTDHGGAIGVESALGKGSTFSVYLPAALARAADGEPSDVGPRRGAGRVLLVEDEPSLLRAASRLVERLGYEVLAFSRSADALDALRADSNRVDVVVTDQQMAELDGLQLAREVASLRADLPVVVVSGNRLPLDEVPRIASVRAVVEKPYSMASLGDAIARALGRA